MQALDHEALQLQQPLLHLSPGLGGGDGLVQLHHLPLAALHVGDVEDVGELQLGDALKALLEVGLDAGWVFGLGENLQQLIVGQEEETWKVETLFLQIVVKTLRGAKVYFVSDSYGSTSCGHLPRFSCLKFLKSLRGLVWSL